MFTQQYALNLAKSFVADCEKNGLKIDKAMVFGSVAKNNIHEYSDIDVLLVSTQFKHTIYGNAALYSKANYNYPIIETHPYPTDYFLRGDMFLDDIKDEWIEIK